MLIILIKISFSYLIVKGVLYIQYPIYNKWTTKSWKTKTTNDLRFGKVQLWQRGTTRCPKAEQVNVQRERRQFNHGSSLLDAQHWERSQPRNLAERRDEVEHLREPRTHHWQRILQQSGQGHEVCGEKCARYRPWIAGESLCQRVQSDEIDRVQAGDDIRKVDQVSFHHRNFI